MITDNLIQSYRTWHKAQPNKVSYTRARNYLSSLMGITNGEAELALAKLQEEKDEIKIINIQGKKGRRIFLKPLPELTEEHIRKCWDGGLLKSTNISNVVDSVHNNTGHSKEEIRNFIETIDGATIDGTRFKWNDKDIPEDY